MGFRNFLKKEKILVTSMIHESTFSKGPTTFAKSIDPRQSAQVETFLFLVNFLLGKGSDFIDP